MTDESTPIIRPFRRDDYPAIAALWNRVHPDDTYSAESIAQQDAAITPPQKFERLLAERDGRIVGAASFSQFAGMYHPHKFFVDVHVAPEAEGHGLGRRLYERLLERLEAHRPIALRGQVSETHPRALRIVRELGYVETKRDWILRLELAAFDPAPFAAEAEVATSGIAIRSFAELLHHDPEAGRKLHALFSEVRLDVPRSEPATPLSYEEFAQRVYGAPDFDAEGSFVALHGSEWVGLTQLWRGASEAEGHVGLTGVRAPFRRRGIATALKLRAIAHARERGLHTLQTDNDSGNLAMLAINERLGFVRQPARLSLAKVLVPDAS